MSAPVLLANESVRADDNAFELFTNRTPERPCEVSFEGERPNLTVQLEKIRGDWKINFWVDHAPAALVPYFDGKLGLRDEEKFRKSVPYVTVGDKDIEVTGAEIWEAQRASLSDQSAASLEVEPLRRVAQLLKALPTNEVRFGSFIMVGGLKKGLAEFQSCAWAAIGVPEGEALRLDKVAESRMVFEDALQKWAQTRSLAKACGVSVSPGSVDAMIDEGSSSFFPGLFNYYVRADWVKSMRLSVSTSDLTGLAERSANGCGFGLDALERGWRDVLEKSIDAATD